MAHQVETLAYVQRTTRDIPWHKLGTAVAEGASDAEQIVEAAGLGWRVALEPLWLHPRDTGPIPNSLPPVQVPNARAIVRQTDRAIFGVATDSYTPLQNKEAFEAVSEWLSDGRLQFETAGALGNGSRVFGLARVGEDFYIGGKDQIIPYVLLTNGHDGKTSVVLKPVTTRVVCANTLALALREGAYREYRIRHTASVKQRIAEASQALELITKHQTALAAKFEQLAQTKASDEDVERVAAAVIPLPQDPTYEEARRIQNERVLLRDVYFRSPTVDRGTVWGAFNAATEFIDHVQVRRGQNPTSTNKDWLARRALFSLEGDGATARQRAYAALVGPGL